MKNTYLTIVFLLILHISTQAQEQLIVAGQIKHLQDKTANLIFRPNLLIQQGLQFMDTIDAEGNFRLSFTLNQPFVGQFVHGKQNIPLFLHPGDSLYLAFDGKKMRRSIQFSGKTPCVANNRFLTTYYNKLTNDITLGSRDLIKQLEPFAYQYYGDSLQKYYHQSLTQYNQSHPLTDEFVALMQAKINYATAISYISYPYLHQRLNRSNSLPTLPDDYYDFLGKIALQWEQGVYLQEYVDFIDAYLSDQVMRNMQKEKGYDFSNMYGDKADIARQHLSNRPLYFMLAKLIMDGCMRGKIERLVPAYDYFNNHNPYAEYAKVVDKIYGDFKHLAAGNPAPDFPLETLDSQTINISDLKGKVVYVDFWATWCIPCKREFPHARKLKERFKEDEEEVVFLYISTDQAAEEEVWRKFVPENDMVGLQTMAKESRAALSNAYKLHSIPRYVLIDREGNIADSRAKRPSSSDGIYNDIKRLLNKKQGVMPHDNWNKIFEEIQDEVEYPLEEWEDE